MGVHRAVLLIAATCAAATSLLFFSFTVDDAFIVARYAVNARDLGDWAFNAGERVSALTSPLHGMLMVALSFVAADPIRPYKFVALALAITAPLMALVRFGVFRREAMPLAAVFAAPSITLWTFAGLETPLLMGLVTAMAAVFSISSRNEARAVVVLGALAGATVLTRYDAVLFAGPVLLAALVRVQQWPARMAAAGLAALPLLMWFAYSFRRFDSVLPTSFFIKTPSAAFDVISANTMYIAEHLAISGIALMALYTAVRLAASGRARSAIVEEFTAHWGLHAGLVAVLAYGTTMATVHMMFAFRHFVPYLGATALALALVARRTGGLPQAAPMRWLEPAVALLMLGVHALHAEALYHRSLQGLGTGGEYAAQGTAGYTRDFIPAMRRNAMDTRAHWQRLNVGRAPRIWTFAAGALPYEYMDAYIFEELVSFRLRCPAIQGNERPDARHWRGHADYVHAFTRHGRLNRLLAPVRARDVTQISEQSIHFNGRDEKLLVFYNPAPAANPLPARMGDPCVAVPPQLE
jgi:hypothetical protein